VNGGERNAGCVKPSRDGQLLALALVALVVLALASSGVAAASAASLTPSSPVTRGSGYVALGDSVTFGYQESAVSPAPDYQHAASFRGYPEQLGTELHLKVANFACPGETAASLINVKAPTLACENAYRLAYPLHVRYRGSQLGAALAYLHSHPGVRLVSLMIGANDLFRCQAVTPDACASPAEQRTTLAEISRNVHRILSALRDHAHYNGQIVVVNYYSLNYASALVNTQSQELNRAQDVAAEPFHVRFADGYGEFRTASLRFGSQPCLAGLITQVGSYGKCGIHPSYAGQALLAKAVASATRL
jgi:lysophospholipase L1-like esterase